MKSIFYILIILIITGGCKERYTPPVGSPPTGYLVVEGFINNGLEPTVITLSRTTTLYDSINTNTQVFEYGAQVTIEGNGNESYPLSETGGGTYTSQPLLLNSNEQYRLHIFTSDGKEYLSDFTPVKNTPPIDSLNWTRDGEGVHIFANTHDDLNNTKYYQWQYDETWEIHSAYQTNLHYVITLVGNDYEYAAGYRFPSQAYDTMIYKCWRAQSSSSILLGSTDKLSSDKIFLPLLTIPSGSEQLSVLYSLNLKQHAISKANYEFLQKMKKNTEQLGSIFDAQPSELKGNIHCVNGPDEIVIGYMEVSQIQTLRKFISRSEVPDWGYQQGCKEIEIDNLSDSIKRYGLGAIPTNVVKYDPLGGIVRFSASDPKCVDCTLRGTNQRPPFWP